MKIGILCAGDIEAAPFLPLLKNHTAAKKSMLESKAFLPLSFFQRMQGQCRNRGTILIDTYRCGMLINAGTAGGLDGKLEIFVTVIAAEAAYHDVDGDILTDFHP